VYLNGPLWHLWSNLGMLAKVAATKECLMVLLTPQQWIVKWDSGTSSNHFACWAFGLMLSSYFSAILSTDSLNGCL
jgi:hypothetical protein